jgi:hypothetical protein
LDKIILIGKKMDKERKDRKFDEKMKIKMDKEKDRHLIWTEN